MAGRLLLCNRITKVIGLGAPLRFYVFWGYTMSKSFPFQGSQERLHRMVSRYQGIFLGNQKFELRWQSDRYKDLFRRTFSIRCHYEKAPYGYFITYRIRPTVFSCLYIGMRLAFWFGCFFCVWDPVEPAAAIASGMIGAACALTDYWQFRDCEKDFLRRFTVATK